MPSATASQTIGPFWHLLEDPAWADLTRFGAEGERVVLRGRIVDGAGAPLADGCVELWQTSPEASDTWTGFGRAATDANGEFRFVTLKPAPLPIRPHSNVAQAPHCALTLFARGLLIHLHTRVYFAGEALNDHDPLLSSLSPARRGTLIARPDGSERGMPVWRLDIRLQGDGETVFLDI